MGLQRVKIVSDNDSLRTRCFVGENELHNVQGVDFKQAAGEVPQFKFYVFGLPDIDSFGDVQFSFTPETVQQAAIVLQNEFKSNQESKKALIASIECAIDDSKKGISTRDLSEIIANTIIGLEDN